MKLSFEDYCYCLGGRKRSFSLGDLYTDTSAAPVSPLSGAAPFFVRDYIYQNDKNGRFGIEILFLRLSLFAQLLGVCIRNNMLASNGNIDLSSIGVRIHAPTTPLTPLLWAFTLELDDDSIASGQSNAANNVLTPSAKLASLYFQTLLINSENDSQIIDAALKPVFDNKDNVFQQLNAVPLLAKKHLFYIPDEAETAGISASLWKKIINFGVEILESTPSKLAILESNAYLLMEEVWKYLFSYPPKIDTTLDSILAEFIQDYDRLSNNTVAVSEHAIKDQHSVPGIPDVATPPVIPEPVTVAPVLMDESTDEEFAMDETMVLSSGMTQNIRDQILESRKKTDADEVDKAKDEEEINLDETMIIPIKR